MRSWPCTCPSTLKIVSLAGLLNHEQSGSARSSAHYTTDHVATSSLPPVFQPVSDELHFSPVPETPRFHSGRLCSSYFPAQNSSAGPTIGLARK